MRKIFAVFLWLVTSLATLSFAQTGGHGGVSLSGTVIDGDDKSPVAQAAVQLLSLPDSAMAVGQVTNNKGYFILSSKPGKYVLKISYLGYQTQLLPVTLSAKTPQTNMGKIVLPQDAIMLGEAIVVAEAPQVTISEDTIGYNASAYRTPEGAMLEELVKKLPGAEIDDDGNVTINGKEVKKLMVDGKEFFGGDVKTGLKNLPVDMVEKLKTYDKKSDLARVTGIDDGEEETVLDLTVKKGMNQGWFGNVDLAAGNKDRYQGRFMVNRFYERTQFSLMGQANNVNDQGFGGGGGGPRWRRNNGLNATKMIGANFATETDKLELGGSARYNFSDGDIQSQGQIENFLTNGSSYSNSNSMQRNKSQSVNIDFRMEWKPDSMTNIIFRPNFSWSKANNRSVSQSATFNSDPYKVVENPNDYLSMTDDEMDKALDALFVNKSNTGSLTKSHTLSADATLQVNRKLSRNGRNITFRGQWGMGDTDSDQYTSTMTNYYQDGIVTVPDTIRRYITTPTNSHNYSAQVTYSEPLGRGIFLQFSYQYQYKYSESDKQTFNMPYAWWFTDGLTGYSNQMEKDADQSKYAEYKYSNHDAMVSLRFNREKWQLSTGLSFQPQHTVLSYKKGAYETDTVRNVFNFAPNVDLRFKFSKVSQLRLTYRGRSGQPSMENLLPITDNSDPLNIRVGNPGLKPSFTHNLRAFYNTYNAEKQRGIIAHINAQMVENSISNSRLYNETTGGWTTTPQNINGNWNAFGMFGYNTALPNKKYTVNSFSTLRYANNVGYLTDNSTKIQQKNTTTELNVSERLNGTYRNDWFEFGVNGSFSYSSERDKLTPSNNQEPYTFSYGANTQVTMPWSMTLSTNITNQSRRGYSDASMNRNELIWNAQLAQSMLKGAATLSFEMYDILHRQSNITRSLTSSGRSVYTYNGVNSYCMVHFIYRFNIFGSKEARDRIMKNRPGGPDGPGGRPGGFGGPPPGGGPGGRPF
jgi:hypothetical protein